jgi:hypothetical protein
MLVAKALRTMRSWYCCAASGDPTFFTRDLGFYTPQLRHQHYAIVVAAVGQYELAAFVRRFLRHPEFDAHAKRVGKIVRIASSGNAWWATAETTRGVRAMGNTLLADCKRDGTMSQNRDTKPQAGTFQHLGLPNAEEHFVKAQLGHRAY